MGGTGGDQGAVRERGRLIVIVSDRERERETLSLIV